MNRRYETRPAARGLGDASVTLVGRRPKTRRSVSAAGGQALGIRRLDVIDPNRWHRALPFPNTGVRACVHVRVTAFFTARFASPPPVVRPSINGRRRFRVGRFEESVSRRVSRRCGRRRL